MNLLLIPWLGFNGAAIATSFSYFVAWFASNYSLSRLITIEFPKIIWAKLILAGLVFVTIINYTKSILIMNPWAELIVSAAIAGLVYLGVISVMKIIDIEEIKHYMRLLR
jgi:O-antigen/teichoic acid export membrane protein